MSKSHIHARAQSGSALLEALIAVLIFSLGILGVVGMQGTAVKLTTDARYRSEACVLANQLLGKMWVSDRSVAALRTTYASATTPQGAGYTAWLGDASTPGTVAGSLPGVGDYPPEVSVDDTGGVTVTVKWHPPTELSSAAAHQYVAKAQIR